jgi:hypothetical protein
MAVSLVGFSSLMRGDQIALTGYHVQHIFTILVWLVLLGQLAQIRTRALIVIARSARRTLNSS